MKYPPFDYLNHISRYKCGECGYEHIAEWWTHDVHYRMHRKGVG